MKKINLKNHPLEELKQRFKEQGIQPFRATQVYQWIFKKSVEEPLEFKNLPSTLRRRISNEMEIPVLYPDNIQVSKIDNTTKYTLELYDGEIIESVIIPDKERRTLCISSQAGCKMGCKFCYTGQGGWRRDLEPWEIVEQVVVAIKYLQKKGEKLSNIVFMGMGEPLDNYENVVNAIKIITDENGLSISPRRISVSTVGIATQIEKLVKETGVNLSLSLNAPDNLTRNEIMPINKKYPIEVLLQILKKVEIPRRKRIVIEYVLLKDVNDKPDDAKKLADLLKGIPVKINLIPFNPFPGSKYERPEDKRIIEFQQILIDSGFSVFIRSSKGRDILAACGQLRGTILNEFTNGDNMILKSS